MPIQQWLYFDAIECLPANASEELTEAACQPVCVDCLAIVVAVECIYEPYVFSHSVPDVTYNVFSGTLNPTQSISLQPFSSNVIS